jgi:hypothetical protein
VGGGERDRDTDKILSKTHRGGPSHHMRARADSFFSPTIGPSPQAFILEFDLYSKFARDGNEVSTCTRIQHVLMPPRQRTRSG